MAIYIDSGDLHHIQQGLDLGWVSGVTTNPLLLAKSNTSPRERLQEIKALCRGPIFYQLMAGSYEAMLKEAHQAEEILEKQLVVKLPPNELGFKVCSTLSTRMACCPTAIYAEAQAAVAREAGAQYLAVYVNRATRLQGDGVNLLKGICDLLNESGTAVLAASLKSPEEAVAALNAGADHLTLPYATLMAMSQHDLSQAAISEFMENGVGI